MNYDEALTITKGQQDAALFLVDYINYCHLLDDCFDRDQLVDDNRLVSDSLSLLGHFAANPWAMQNWPRLYPLVVSGFNAWLDANNMAESVDDNVRLSSDTVKGIYHEIVYVTAYLCGGYSHMREISRSREYDYDQKRKV